MLRLSLRSNVVAAYLSALMVCGTGWITYHGYQDATAATARSRHILSVMNSVRAVDDRVRDAETTERELLSTGNPGDAADYAAATAGALQSLAALRRIALPYPEIASRVDSLGYFVHLRLAELDGTVALRRQAGSRAPSDSSAPSLTNDSSREIGDLLGAIGATIQRSEVRYGSDTNAKMSQVTAIVAVVAVFALLLALFVNFVHTRNVRAQRHMTGEMENQALQLQFQTHELTVANRELENATREMLRQTVEAERSEMRLAGILGSATDAVVSFDDDERVVYFNAAARRLFGLDEAAIPGVHILAVVAARSVPAFEERMLSARRNAHTGATAPEVWDTLIVRPDDGEVPVEVSMAYARTGTQGLFTAVLRDVSRQRRFEEELRQAQKMEAVGRLAGGIAHDFNNLLTVIGASSDFLLHDLKKDHPTSLSEDVREIKAATNRAATLTRQLLAFSRRQLVQPQMLDVNVIVRDMETMLRRLIGEDTLLATEYSDEVGLVKVDRGQLEQVVVNLVVNARDAMPGGGTIRLCTGRESIMGSGALVPVECATIAVADSGVGMDEQTRARVFEPFFTTKEPGKGTGLGLSTVYGIVKACGGDIVVESAVGSGTEFRVKLPTADDGAAPAPLEPASSGTARGYETILVVEDEEPLRRLTRRILESRGYTVFEAANGHEAIQRLACSGDRVDLLLTDVVMPGMSGRELVERVLPVYPWLRVLFMSGYTEDMMLQHRVSELGITLVEKPYTGDDLALAVRSTLDRTAETAEVG